MATEYATTEFVKAELKKAVEQISQFMGTEMKRNIEHVNMLTQALQELQNVSNEHADSYQKLTDLVDNLYLHTQFLLHHTEAFKDGQPQQTFIEWCALETEKYQMMDQANREASKSGVN